MRKTKGLRLCKIRDDLPVKKKNTNGGYHNAGAKQYHKQFIFLYKMISNIMCFDPKSPANAKLKKALLELLQENQK